MSAPQLTDANTSSEWFRKVAEPGAGSRTPSQIAIQVTRRRQGFVRLVAYTMVGLVAFTLLGLASFAWRRHSMQAALAAPVPVTALPATAPLGLVPAPLGPVPAAPALAAEPLVAPPTPVAAVAPRTAGPTVAKAKPALKPARRPSPFLGAKKLAAKPGDR